MARVLLLRGINVGGRNLLPMKELVALLEALGCAGARSYLQSGNVVLRCHARRAREISRRLPAEIERSRGFRPWVLLLEAAELESAVSGNPFPEAESDPRSLHLGMLEREPPSPRVDELEARRAPDERFILSGRFFYLHAPSGIARSRLAAAAEALLGVSMTSRNWRTVTKLIAIARELGADSLASSGPQ